MECDKWEDVLIQWINCLKLTDPINDLESLKNGDFFLKLLGVLEPTNSSIAHEDCLATSVEIIKTHYPNYIFDQKDHTDLYNLSIENIVVICSLLLHFGCVIEKKDLLIIPSCNKLSSGAQINIRNFLEKVNTKITKFHLKKIIDEMNEFNVSLNSYQWTPIGDSPVIGKSPLHDFLKSPYRTTSLQKDRELKKLKSELEIERFEKADLQEELREHKEQIKRLEYQIKEKSSEVSKIRSKLFTLENKTPPLNRISPSIDIERQLKLQIQTLEQYVEQLQSQQDDLQEENTHISEKLKNSIKELKEWQQTAQTLELNNKELSEKYTRQELELENLKLHCLELSAMLEEIRGSNDGNDSTMLFSPSKSKRRSMADNTMSSENLAHTIIDVQLKDAVKENLELKNLLKESTERGNDLQIELLNTKTNYEELCKNFTEKEKCRNDLLEQFTDLNKTHDTLNQLKLKTEEEINQLSKLNLEKDSLISSLHLDLEKSKNLCKEYEDINKNINNNLNQLNLEVSKCKNLLTDKDVLYENLQKEANLLQVKYDDTVKHFNNTNFELESFKESYEEFTRKLEQSLMKLENVVCGYNEMKFDDNFLDNVITRLQNNKSDTDKEIKCLKQSINDYEDLVYTLNQQITALKREEQISSEEKEALKNVLSATEANVEKLAQTIGEQSAEINQKVDKILELNNFIEELKKLEQVIIIRDQKISNLEATIEQKQIEIGDNITEKDILKDNLQKMENVKNTLEEGLESKNKRIKALEEENFILNQQICEIKLEVDEVNFSHMKKMEEEKLHLEKIYISNLQIQELSEKIEQVETDLKITTENLALKCMELVDLKKAKQLMEENYIKVAEDLNRKIEITNDTVKKLEIELSIVKNERNSLQDDVNNLNSDYQKLLSEKNKLLIDINDLKIQLKTNFEKLSSAEDECSQKDNIISENSKELLNIKLNLESKKREYKNLQENVEKLNMEASSYKFCIDTLKVKNSDFENKIIKLEKELQVLNNLKDSLEKKNLELEKNMNEIMLKVTLKNKELNEIIKNFNEQKMNNEVEVNRLHGLLQQANKNVENLENENMNEIGKHNKEITKLKEEINQLNNKIYELNAKEVNYIHEIQVIKSDLNAAFEKYTQSFDEQQELKLEYEAQIKTLTENIHEMVTNYNKLEKDHQHNLSELEVINEQFEMLKEEKVVLEIKIIDQKKKYDQEIEQTNEQFTTDFKQLKDKQMHLEQSLLKAKTDLEQQKGVRFRLENDVKKLIIKIGELEIEKAEFSKKIESLQSIKFKLEDDYKSLKLNHEQYILESGNNLKQRENQLQNDINNLQTEKENIEKEKGNLENLVSSLKVENESYKKQIEDNQKKYEEQLIEVQNKIEYYKSTNSRIIEEQRSVEEKMLSYQQQNENNNKIITEQAETILKLKSAYDILQTGKERIEVDLEYIQDSQKKMESEQIAKQIELNDKVISTEEKLEALNREIENHKILLSNKDVELSNLNTKLVDLQNVNEAMKNEIHSTEQNLRRSNECHQMFLNKIDEENLQTIKDMSCDFDILKSKYEKVSDEIISFREEREKLKKAIETSSKNISDFQKLIDSKDIALEELKSNIRHVEEIRHHKETIINELSEELTDTVNNLVLVKNDKLKLDVDLEEAHIEINRLKKSRDDILDAQNKIIRETENNISRAHANAIDVKNDLLLSIENAKEEAKLERNEKCKLQKLLDEERSNVKVLEIELLNMKNVKSKYEQLYSMLRKNIDRLYELINLKGDDSDNLENIEEENLQKIITELEKNIIHTYKKSRELTDLVSKLQVDSAESKTKLQELENEKSLLNDEKKELLVAYNNLIEKNQLALQQQSREKEIMQQEITTWINKFEQNSSKANDINVLKTENEVLHQTIISLKDKNVKAYNIYKDFSEMSRNVKTMIDKILKERNGLETLIHDLRQSLIDVQSKFLQLNREHSLKHQEQKESFEFIVDDIQKQFNRYSKIAYNLAYNNVQVSEMVMQGILSEKYVDWQPLLNELNIDEVSEKMEELKGRASDSLDQLKMFNEVLNKNEAKTTKVLKENVLKVGTAAQITELKKDEEWRKKCTMLRQKLTLTENVKNNYEKKVKQLREENKRLLSESKNVKDNSSYAMLLQQHTQTKEEFEKKISELKTKYQKLQAEYIDLKKQKSKPEEAMHDLQNMKEIQILREAYEKVMSDNFKLNSDNDTLKKVIECRNNELVELSLVKEAYEKLLEENSKMMTEVDTLRYKRSRDKEEFVNILKKEREDYQGRENEKVQDVRAEYEKKLEAMKVKMLNLYKEEIERETRRFTSEKENCDMLKLELDEYKRIIEHLKMSQKQDLFGSHESLGALSIRSECDIRDIRNVRNRNTLDSRNSKGHNGNTIRSGIHDRRYATLPRNMSTIQECNKIPSTNPVPPDLGQNLEMEDEGELFNNKYLTDLKDGICVVGTSGESRTSRVSELAWRNSMCPPHLKSSYPAEMQFASPTKFREEDIKSGNIEFDDSMSTKLLPGEKSRKKDIGTTSYKKPGPPTPSKNGGRLSLQSNEIQLSKDLHEAEAKTPKRSTPGRFKAFFLGLNSNSKSCIENQASTPKPKVGNRIFRKPK